MALAFDSSARSFQMFTAGSGASWRGLNVDRSKALPLTFSEVFSAGSTDLSTEVEACDLFSQVDSDDVFGSDETSSSLVTVEEDEAPRSGDDTVDSGAGCSEVMSSLGAGVSPLLWSSTTLAGFSAGRSFASTSSAQLIDAAGSVEGTKSASLDGATVSEDGLLGFAVEAGAAERPLAACAYEKATGGAAASLPALLCGVAIMALCST